MIERKSIDTVEPGLSRVWEIETTNINRHNINKVEGIKTLNLNSFLEGVTNFAVPMKTNPAREGFQCQTNRCKFTSLHYASTKLLG